VKIFIIILCSFSVLAEEPATPVLTDAEVIAILKLQIESDKATIESMRYQMQIMADSKYISTTTAATAAADAVESSRKALSKKLGCEFDLAKMACGAVPVAKK
jgi:hypothetical protein